MYFCLGGAQKSENVLIILQLSTKRDYWVLARIWFQSLLFQWRHCPQLFKTKDPESSLFKIFLNLCFIWVVCSCVCECLQKTGKGIRFPGTGVRGDGKSPFVDARNQILVVCKSIWCVNDQGISPVPIGIITKDQPLHDQFFMSD